MGATMPARDRPALGPLGRAALHLTLDPGSGVPATASIPPAAAEPRTRLMPTASAPEAAPASSGPDLRLGDPAAARRVEVAGLRQALAEAAERIAYLEAELDHVQRDVDRRIAAAVEARQTATAARTLGGRVSIREGA